MSSQGFNPVKIETDGKRAKRVVWSTTSLNLALKGLNEGKKLVANPFYDNNIKLLKGDLLFERTDEEIAEWQTCADDVLHFANVHCQLMTPEGIQHIKLREYQERYLKHLEKNRLSIYLSCRQSAKTTSSAIFLLHYACFNVDKNALVLGNKRKTAVEILDKIKKIYLELPYYLKPGIYKWNEAEIVFDNGCRIMAESTTVNSGISFTFHCVLADEFAHVKPNILDEFYNNLFPVVTAAKARFMITSTQKGYNLFYRLYKSAEAGDNEYKAFKTDWWEVPEWNPEEKKWEKRDEKWHRLQVANYGSEEAFNKQFGTNFDVSAKTLVSQKVISREQQKAVEFVNKDMNGVPFSHFFFWKPDYEPSVQLRRDYLVIPGDIAEGLEQDYTVFPIYRMIEPGTDKLECIGFYRCSSVSREDVPRIIQYMCSILCNQDHLLISLELNTYGELFLKYMDEYCESDQIISDKFDPSCIVKYYNETGTSFKRGIKITPGNKTPHCVLFKEDYESGKIINISTQFLSELTNFNDDGTGHYKAIYGHDDFVMSSIQLEFIKKTLQYKIMRSEFNELMINKNSETVDSDEDNVIPISDYLPDYNQTTYNNSYYDDYVKQLSNKLK